MMSKILALTTGVFGALVLHGCGDDCSGDGATTACVDCLAKATTDQGTKVDKAAYEAYVTAVKACGSSTPSDLAVTAAETAIKALDAAAPAAADAKATTTP